MDFVLAILGLVLAGTALVLGQRLKQDVRRLSAGVDSAIQTASRSRVASDAAAATLSRDQDELWRMRFDVDNARTDAAAIRDEIQSVRRQVIEVQENAEGLHRNIDDVRKDIAAVRRVLIGLRDDLEDLSKNIQSAQVEAGASPLPIPTPSHSDTLEMLRQQLRAEQQVADPDDDDR
jgi:chromosome segregation ATPase